MPPIDAATLAAVALAVIAIIVPLTTLLVNRKTAKDIKESDDAKTFMATLIADVKDNRLRIAELQTSLQLREEQHAAEVDRLRSEREQIRDEKHKQANDFQTATLDYEHKLAEAEMRHRDAFAEMKRCYDVEIAEMKAHIQALELRLAKYEGAAHDT